MQSAVTCRAFPSQRSGKSPSQKSSTWNAFSRPSMSNRKLRNWLAIAEVERDERLPAVVVIPLLAVRCLRDRAGVAVLLAHFIPGHSDFELDVSRLARRGAFESRVAQPTATSKRPTVTTIRIVVELRTRARFSKAKSNS